MKFSHFWEKDLKASKFALGVVREGYKIPFESNPPPFYAKNNASSLKNDHFVKDSIKKLLEDSCIEKVSEPPYCINPLTVAERNSKLRLVLDLRHVNKFITKPNKFKYENLKQALELIDQNDFLITFDLKSGYHHVPINHIFRTFLGFAWEFDGKMQFFVFKVLPFGLNIACLVFTKLMRQLVKRWRSMGIKCAMYLDDGIAGDSSHFSLIRSRDRMLQDMQSAGLTVNFEKSSLEPEKRKTWLGFIIDTEKMKFEVPTTKILKVQNLLLEALNCEFISAREISRIAGNLISMAQAIGPLVYLFTKQLYKFVESSFSWDKKRLLTFDVRQELEFWKENLEVTKSFRINTQPEVTKIVFSDASETGYGGYVVEKLGNIIARGNFDRTERQTSSTYRELLAVKYILLSFPKILENENIEWFTDNNNICRIINRGSTKQHLQNLAIEIFNICYRPTLKFTLLGSLES
uniref:Reverse transcriptase domain-containing protein n=1 Tax=Clytia hemisphaerica TaxID=252671 RepID=A0A7M5XJR3_9CNID